MNSELSRFIDNLCNMTGYDRSNAVEVYPGIVLSYFTVTADKLCIHHEAHDHVLQINYCRLGQAVWEMGGKNRIYLGQNDFSLNTLKSCSESVIYFPTNYYEGLTIIIDLAALADTAPELLRGTGITGIFLYNKFCKDTSVTFLAGNERTENIFAPFFNQPEHLLPAYRKIKVIELLLYLSSLKTDQKNSLTEYQAEQITMIREIHEYLLNHMDERLTIDMLSRHYLMNPTSLKELFKSVYGTSIAAHMKEHRMEEAARLLRETDLSIADIAKQVGYASQSRFSAAFKASFQILPKEYRKRQNPANP